MGRPMARNIIRAGFPLIAYDVRAEPLDSIRAEGASVAVSPAEIAGRAETILTLLPNAATVREVIVRSGGILDALTQRHTVIEMSTTDPGTAIEIAGMVESRGASFLDCPVGGTPDMVERRDAEILVGGDTRALEECSDLLKALSKNVVYVGKAGNGKAMKLAANLLIAMNKLALTEATCFALKHGIEPEIILKVISLSNANSVVFQRYGRAAVAEEAGADEKIAKKHSWQLKDLGLALRSADEASIPLPIGQLAYELTKKASEGSGNSETFESIVKYYKSLMKIS